VDPNYLRRNVITNGVNLGFLAIAPPQPHPEHQLSGDTLQIVLYGDDSLYQHYRVGVRTKNSGSLYFDTLYTFTGTNVLLIPGINPSKTHYISVANVLNNVESLFSDEISLFPVNVEEQVMQDWGIELRQNQPNPFRGRTDILIETGSAFLPCQAEIIISGVSGKILSRIPVHLQPGSNYVEYHPRAGEQGVLFYSLSVQGKIVMTKKMAVL
jgi:hypothetical protein